MLDINFNPKLLNVLHFFIVCLRVHDDDDDDDVDDNNNDTDDDGGDDDKEN